MKLKTIACVLAATTMFAGAWAAQKNWARQYIGETSLSLELPVKLGAGVSDEALDPKDWVAKTTDYIVEGDTFYAQVSVFDGKAGKLADKDRLGKVVADSVEEICSDTYTVQLIESDGKTMLKMVPKEGAKPLPEGHQFKMLDASVGMIDEKPAIRTTVQVTEDGSTYQLKLALIGDGNTVFMILGICFPEEAQSVKDLDRIIKSVRYKKGL